MNIWIAEEILIKHYLIKKSFVVFLTWNTLLLVDVFENFRNKCIETYEFKTTYFISAPKLAWQACLKNRNKIKNVN